jgi:membrane-associated phospholipid phosphatase
MRLVSDAAGEKPDARPRPPSLSPAADLAALISALRDFGAAWVIARHPSPPGTRRGEAILAFLLCAAIVESGYLADAAAARWAMGLPEPLTTIFAKITLLGTSGYIFALSAAVAAIAVLAGRRAVGQQNKARMNVLAGRATFVFAVNLVSGIISQLLKHIAGRARPKLMDIVGPFHFDLFSIKATLASFPSGHTVTAFATAMALSYFAPRLRLPLFLVAALVAFSRLAIGAHYVSDVLAGVFFGIGTVIYMRRAFARRGLVFRFAGTRIRLRAAASPAAALALLADRAGR